MRADPLATVVLRLLRDHGPLSKADLADLAGVSRSTLTGELQQLARAGLVEDGAATPSTGGRRSTLVQLDAGLRLLAIDFGYVQTRLAVTDARLETLEVRSIEREQSECGPDEIDRAATAARTLLDDLGIRRPRAVGVSAPVWDDAGVQGYVAQLGERLGQRTVVGRAASTMLLGERHLGSGRGCSDLVAVRLGATIAAATMIGGRLVEGASGLAGDIGHYRVEAVGPPCSCGGRGCLDSFASGVAVTEQIETAARSGRSARLAEVFARGPVTGRDVAEAVAAGDPVAVQIVHDAGRRIGSVLGGLVAVANPERVLLGGILVGLGPAFVEEIRRATRAAEPGPLTATLAIEVGELGDHAGLVGAAHLASDDLFVRPLVPSAAAFPARRIARRRPSGTGWSGAVRGGTSDGNSLNSTGTER